MMGTDKPVSSGGLLTPSKICENCKANLISSIKLTISTVNSQALLQTKESSCRCLLSINGRKIENALTHKPPVMNLAVPSCLHTNESLFCPRLRNKQYINLYQQNGLAIVASNFSGAVTFEARLRQIPVFTCRSTCIEIVRI